MSTTGWIVIAVIIGVALWVMGVYNSLVALGQRVSQAFAAIDVQLRQLFALSEAYPDLKANTNFQQLQAELTDIENKLAAARRFFNNAVAEFNAAIQQFPAVLLAGAMGFRERTFFDVGADRATVAAAPEVKF